MSLSVCSNLPGDSLNSLHLQQYENPEERLGGPKLLQVTSGLFHLMTKWLGIVNNPEDTAKNVIFLGRTCRLAHLYLHEECAALNQMHLEMESLQNIWKCISSQSLCRDSLQKPSDTAQFISLSQLMLTVIPPELTKMTQLQKICL